MLEFRAALQAYRAARRRIDVRGIEEAEMDRRVERLCESLAELMEAPALTARAIATKLEIAIAENPTPSGGGVIPAIEAAAILRDVRALA